MYNYNRIIAIGDIHGDYKIFIKCLQVAKLIDINMNWIGKDTYLIQLGDTLDGKRPGSKIDSEFLQESGEVEILRYILYLDSQAKNQGGRVISLIGNHELYPYYLQNDKSFIRDFVKTADINEFKKHYKVDRIKFLQPGNIGGSLIGKTRPLVLQLGEFLFIHGSITDTLIKTNLINGKVDIPEINKKTSLWLQGKGKIPEFLSDMSEENPVFSRLYSNKKDFTEKECKKLEDQLKRFNGVNYVVMGHSSFKTINTTCNKKLIRTDISLSRAFGGKISDKKVQMLEINQFPDQDPDINILTEKDVIKLI